MTPSQRRASWVRRHHRGLGASAAIFIVFMVITGVIINHSHSLGLDRKHVASPYLLKWYGLEAPEQISSFPLKDKWLSVAGSSLYLDEAPVTTASGVIGAVIIESLTVVAAGDEWILLDPAGQLIERQTWPGGMRNRVDAIGTLQQGAVVVRAGENYWQADEDLISWHPAGADIGSPVWSASSPAPAQLVETINRQYRGEGPSLERLILDLHSGRFFGPVGVFIYDVLAFALGFLAISGIVLWSRARRNGKR